MGIDLTARSAAALNRISTGRMTPALAAQYLSDGQICLRTFQEVLRELYPAPDLAKRLAAAFHADEPEASSAAQERTVYNWVSGRSTPASREDVFHIAFALGLSEPQLNALLGVCFDYGIHYREGRDIVYAWFLRMGKTYAGARRFFLSLPPAPQAAAPPRRAQSGLTHELHGAFLLPRNEDELRTCYLAHLEDLGRLHARAYQYFEHYLALLVRPGPEERSFSMEEVARQYLSMHMPLGRSRVGYGLMQRLLKQNWPNATLLKNIRLRKADVSRKLLLLLYVATENGLSEGYSELDEEYVSPRERLEDHWVTLNVLLTDCGMPTLDPRSPMDWLVLYALTAEEESMSQRMEQVVDEIFANI